MEKEVDGIFKVVFTHKRRRRWRRRRELSKLIYFGNWQYDAELSSGGLCGCVQLQIDIDHLNSVNCCTSSGEKINKIKWYILVSFGGMCGSCKGKETISFHIQIPQGLISALFFSTLRSKKNQYQFKCGRFNQSFATYKYSI